MKGDQENYINEKLLLIFLTDGDQREAFLKLIVA